MIKVPLGYFCNWGHAIKHGQVKAAEKSQKAARVKHKVAKESVKTKAKWLAELQALVNQYVRLRDQSYNCISCDKGPFWDGQWHAGHYYSRGHSAALRFNLNNIHKQCSVCNNHLSGNIGEYTPKLQAKIGIDKFDELLESKSDVRSYDIEWIKRAKIIAKKAIKRYK